MQKTRVQEASPNHMKTSYAYRRLNNGALRSSGLIAWQASSPGISRVLRPVGGFRPMQRRMTGSKSSFLKFDFLAKGENGNVPDAGSNFLPLAAHGYAGYAG